MGPAGHGPAGYDLAVICPAVFDPAVFDDRVEPCFELRRGFEQAIFEFTEKGHLRSASDRPDRT